MTNQMLVTLNFWEAKQLEYWLKDNYSELSLRPLYDKYTPPEEEDWYAIEGDISVDVECLIKLKYGNKIIERPRRVTNG